MLSVTKGSVILRQAQDDIEFKIQCQAELTCPELVEGSKADENNLSSILRCLSSNFDKLSVTMRLKTQCHAELVEA